MQPTSVLDPVQPSESRLAWGVDEIAAEIERTNRQAHYLLTKGQIKSARKIGGKWCAGRAALRREFGIEP